MAQPLQTIGNRGLRAKIDAVSRIKGFDLLLFFVLMMYKLVLFDRFVKVPNMAMSVDDVFVALGTLALVCFWTLWLPIRGRILALTILNVVLTAIVYSDLVYFRYFQDMISIPVLMQAGQVGALGDSIGSLLSARDIWFFIDWPFIIPLVIYLILRKREYQVQLSFAQPKRLRRAVVRMSLSLIIFATGVTLVFVPINIAKKTWAVGLFVGNWWNMSLYNVTGVIGFHGYDIYRYANEHWLHDNTIPAAAKNEAKQWFEERGNERKQLESDPLFGKYKGKNVIMVQLEAFQNFVIGQKINGQEVTPNMNKLLGESMYFKNFYHQTSQGRTSDADLAANASLQPLMTGSVFIRYAQHEYDSMPSTLKDNGYTTSVFHAYDGGFWNRNAMYQTLKYDTFYSKKSFTIDEPLGWSLGDTSFFRQSVDLMKKQKQPFYSFMITLSSHHPYTLPESYQTLNVGSFKGTIFGDYLEAVHYVDASVGKLVAQLKEEGLWDKSIFLFYGDHDNSIREWEPFETFLGKPLSELDRLNILKQVPFVVHLPNGDHAGVYDQVGGQLDVTPTVLHLLGISTADKYFVGTPLVTEKPLAGKKVVLRDGSYTDGKIFYIPPDDGKPEHSKCYDVASGKLTDVKACEAGVDPARKELVESDLVIQHDLIKEFKKK
ncbi:LTA synthase family protein [Paenibacillus solisilvae]|uniref:LTA synthase family protein n=1 Tax=Paenibacillus solisilvae TaxID=2486751 RepID=A0ABW0W3I6_9BACL